VKIKAFLFTLFALVTLMFVIVPAPVAHAGAITVTSNAGTKVTGDGCTLREAIENANNNAATWPDCAAGSGADIITLPAGVTITLTEVDHGSNQGADGLSEITSNITINGNNSIIERSSAGGTPQFRLFDIASGVVTLNNVTVRNGRAGDGPVGLGGGFGGGINNQGALTLNNSTVSANRTGDGAWDGDGGGIYSYGALTVTNSAVISNTTDTGYGAGIAFTGEGLKTIINSTIAYNSTSGGGGGGGIKAQSDTTLTLTNSTIAFNAAGSDGGGGIWSSLGPVTLTLTNTIIANNTATANANCRGTVNDGGNNLDSGTTCGWSAGTKGSLSSSNPKLGPLANLGGATKVLGLLSGSPAINGVTYNAPNGCPAADQRGVLRPIGAYCDIGAFEGTMSLLNLPLIVR
jgi:hypothetical protein